MNLSVRVTGKEITMTGKAFDRAVRKTHILQIFYKAFEDNEHSEFTSVQIAKALNLEPSHHIRGMLSEMVRDRTLSSRQVVDNRNTNLKVGQGKDATKNSGYMYLFRLSEKEREQLEKKMREVKVNVNGKQVGQLRLL